MFDKTIIDRIDQITRNINQKIQPVITTINEIQRKMKHITDKAIACYDKDSLTDDKLEIFTKLETLDNSIEKVSDNKNLKYYLNTRERKHELIELLKNINRNHIQKNEVGGYTYRYIDELFDAKETIKKNLNAIKKDKKNFNRLQKKYGISSSKKFDEIDKSTLRINQIVPFLYLWHHGILEGKEDAEQDLKKIFSILFYAKEAQQTFYTKIDEIETSTNNICWEIYYDFLQHAYLDKAK